MSKTQSNLVQVDVNELEALLRDVSYKLRGVHHHGGAQHIDYVNEVNGSSTSGSLAPGVTDEKHPVGPVVNNVEHGPLIDHQIPQDTILQEGAQEPQLTWARIRHIMREPFSEFFGVFILILFGDGVVAQVVLSGGAKGDFQSINWGWG